MDACTHSRALRASIRMRRHDRPGNRFVTCATFLRGAENRAWPRVATSGKRRAIRAYQRNHMITGLIDTVRNVRYGVNKERRDQNSRGRLNNCGGPHVS